MNRKLLFLIIIIFGLILPAHRAFMASNRFEKNISAPVPPMNGRRGEAAFNQYLNNSGTEYQTWYRKGKAYIKRKEYEQAILAFRKAIYLRPAEEEARFLLGWCYEKRGQEGLPGDKTDWDKLAEKEYKAAISLADHLPARYNLALLQRRNERFEEARKNLEHILMIGTKNALSKKAEAELSAIFQQEMRPAHIALDIMENGNEAE
ncbi:MAG: hypothetical protein Kow0029_18070 [Candidatus Rifleibacteriota bacterium]